MKIEDYEIVIRPLTLGEGGGFFALSQTFPAATPTERRHRKL